MTKAYYKQKLLIIITLKVCFETIITLITSLEYLKNNTYNTY
jgi:hypothetical protein